MSHRNAYVREGVLSLFVQAMEIYGGDSISFVALLPHVVRRLEDRDASVREMTLEVLECMYKYTGEELVSHIQQTNLIENHKLQPILTRFNDIDLLELHHQVAPHVRLVIGHQHERTRRAVAADPAGGDGDFRQVHRPGN